MEKVSIIISVYNTERHLARCLSSVVGQTERNLEIICVNDGSTDGSRDILAAYAAKDPRIRIIDRANGGLSAARNSALDVATGEYVMFVDSDDWIPEDAAEKMLAVAQESNLPVVVSTNYAKDRLVRPRRTRNGWRRISPALQGFVSNRRIHSSVWNKLYRRDALGSHRFIDGILFEDWPFNTELFADIPAFALVDEPMYVYSTVGASITRSAFTLEKAESYLKGISHVKAALKGRDAYHEAIRRVVIAIKMLVSKAAKSNDGEIRRLVAAQDFSSYPLDLKTRFRLWRMRRMFERRIVLTGIRKCAREVEFSFSASPALKGYFREKTLRITYPESVEAIPDSVLAVPFVSNVAPLVWLTDATLVVPTLDAAFLECLNRVRDGYRQMFAGRCAFSGEISAVPARNVPKSRDCRSALFFSGGLDSACTLFTHLQERPDLLVVWGADIKYGNCQGWSRLETSLRAEAERYALPLKVIRSTFRKMLDARRLNRDFGSVLGDGWWHGVQHGLALLGHCAPLAHEHGYEAMYMASSRTDPKAICASSPLIDNEFSCVNCRAFHDGFGLNRMEKISRVLAACDASGFPGINLHVCWQSRTGRNCGVCEKCLRTIAGILSNGGDPGRFGFAGYERTFDLEAARKTVCRALRAHRDDESWIAHWGTIRDRLRQDASPGPCPPAVGEFMRWLAAFNFDNELSARAAELPRGRSGLFEVSRKHNDVKYSFGGLMVMKRTARRTVRGARFTYRLFSKIPVWRKEDRTVTRIGPFDAPKSFCMQPVDGESLLAVLRKMEPFTYVPNPGNAGDALIAAATLQFFERHGLHYRPFDGDYSGNVVLGGGGAFTAQYPKFVRRILRATKVSDRVLVLPSTFRGVDGFLAAIDERFTVFARDEESFGYLRQSGTRARTLLGHDMSLFLTDEIFRRTVSVSVLERELQERLFKALAGKRGTLRAMRTDMESAGSQQGDIDLSKFYYLSENSLPDWIFFGACLFLRAIDRFDTIITDRLHVGIGAILLGKRLTWLDDRYHKIGNIYANEFKGNQRITWERRATS